MSLVTSIPCPAGEDYDHPHSLNATLTSLESLLLSFDAIFDSLEASTTKLKERLDRLSFRCDAIQSELNRGPLQATYSPSSLPRTPKQPVRTVREARENSNDAIRRRFRRDAQETDFSGAELADDWLDRADGFDTERMWRRTRVLHVRLPPLIPKNYEKDSVRRDRRRSVAEKSYPFLCSVLHDAYGVDHSSPAGFCESRTLVSSHGHGEGGCNGDSLSSSLSNTQLSHLNF